MNISSSHTREAGRALRWGSVGIGAIDPRSDGRELEARRDQTAPEHFFRVWDHLFTFECSQSIQDEVCASMSSPFSINHYI
jgi:hypothetical protein